MGVMYSLIVHGGAGAIDPRVSTAHQQGCREAVVAGEAILAEGGSALDAACAAVRVLEDNPVFNAGIGGTLDENGHITHDASVMRSDDLAYGAVAAVGGVRNPIDLAHAVLEDGTHSILSGPGAVAFARRVGIELCDPHRHETDPSRSRWWYTEAESVGETVGAVARDREGSVVAATSTGGLLRKYAGRVGDTPIAGAGTYARDDLGGCSTTGHGESILKTVLAYQALLACCGQGEALEPILSAELDTMRRRVGGRGGLIVVRPDGQVAWARNTPHMGVAWVRQGQPVRSDF